MKLFSSSSALVLGTIENMFLTLILASITPMGGPTTSGPSQPANLSATVTNCSKVALVWSASTAPNGASIANYKIYRGGSCIYTNTGATTYTDSTVVTPNNYSYMVSAVDNKGHESAQSSPADVSPCADKTVPGMPSGLNASAANCSQVNLSWNAASDGPGAQYELVSGLQGYKLYRNGAFLKSVASPVAVDSSVAPGTSYSYQVSAIDNSGSESALPTAVVAPVPACAAGPAANVTISLNGTTNHISWTGTPGAPYQVLCAQGFGGPWVPVDLPTTAFAVDSLAVQDAAIYRVALFTNTPGYLANAAMNMADTIAPSVPGNLTVSMVSTSEVDLAWTPSTDTGGSGLAYYFVYRDGLFLQSAPATATGSVDTLPPLTDTAVYGVAAIDSAGNVSAQAANSVSLRPSCTYTLAPSGTNVSATPVSGSFSVTSSKPSCNKNASSGYGWIHVTGSSGSTINYSVDANTASSGRSGNIMVGGVSAFNITQAAAAPSCSYSLSSGSASFGSSGGSANVTVTAGSGCSWTASTAYSWLHTTSTGTGSGTVSFSADANTSSSPVTGTITVGNGANTTTLTVTVAGVAPTCTYSLSSGTASFGSSGGSSSVTVTTASGCSWTASTAYSWLHTTSSGTGSGSVSFSADANTSSSPVTGTITVGNGANTTTLTVTVAGVAPTCTYSLSSGTASFGSSGGSSSVTVTTASGCSWTASTAYSWLHTTSSGTGSGSVSFSADANTSSSTVTGTITIGNGANTTTLTVTVAGVTPTCSYSLSSGAASFGSSGGSSSVTVTTASGCSWTASTAYSWLHTTSSGTGSGTVSFSADANTSSSPVSGTITVGNGANTTTLTVTVAGVAPTCTYSLSSGTASFGSSGGSSSVTVTTASGCSWTASTAYSWLHTTSSGTGSGSVSFSADANTSSSTVTGTITIGNGANTTTLTVTVAGVTPTCSYSLSSGAASFGSSGGSSSVTVTTASGCSWTASTAYSWLHTTSSGTGSGTVSFSADANTSSSPVSGTITVGNGANTTTLTVTVAGVACTYSLSSGAASFGSSGGSSSVTVTTASGCTWTASTAYSWLHTTSSGTGSGSVSFSADANTSSSPVSGTITVGNGASTTTLTVTVAGVAPTCSYSLSSGSASFGASGGSANVTVTTASGCTWTASTAYSWLHTTSAGNGSGTLSFSVDPNNSTNALTGSILVGSGANFATLIVNESGAAPTCTYSLSSSTASLPAGGGSGSVTMTATTGCGWTASTTYPWLHTSSSGSGNGTVFYTVDSNASTSSRSGTITAGGQTLTVNQAATCSYSLSSSSASFPAAGGSGSVNVTAGSGCSWAASTTYAWLHTSSSGSGNGTVSYSVDPNGSSSALSGTITVGGQTFTVSQSPHTAPFANPGPSQTVGVGTTVSFNGSGSVSYDGSAITSYNWTFGDSTSSSGVSVSHAYASAGTYTVNLTVTDSYGVTDPGSTTVTVTNTVIPAPSVPTGLSASAPNCTNVSLSWTGSTDVGGPGLAGYKIYRNGGFLQQVTTTSWTDTSVSPSTTYSYTVSAIDTQGRESAQSSAAGATTSTCGGTGTPGQLQWAWDLTSYFSLSPYAIAADHSNNQIAVGVVFPATNTANFGGSPVQVATGGSLFVAKYSPQKTLLWVKTIAVSVRGSLNGVTVDSQNNIIVSGYFSGVADFGGGLLASVGFADAFVAKYSSSGVYIWARQFSGTGYTYGGPVAVDATNNIVVTANLNSPANFGGINLNPNIALVKLSGSSGTTMWAKSFASTSITGEGDTLNGVTVDRNGDVVMTGHAGGPINLGGGTVGSGGIILAKYSGADGSYKWGKVMGVAISPQASPQNNGNGVTTDPATGNVFLTGGFANSVDFGSGTAVTTPYGQNGGIFLAGYGTSGNYLWSKVWGTSGNAAAGLSVDPSGNLEFVGFVAGYIDWQGTGNWTYTGGNMVVGSFTAAGGYRWVSMLGPCYPASIACDSAGHLAITGHFSGTVDLGGTSLSTIYNPDGFVAQYSE